MLPLRLLESRRSRVRKTYSVTTMVCTFKSTLKPSTHYPESNGTNIFEIGPLQGITSPKNYFSSVQHVNGENIY